MKNNDLCLLGFARKSMNLSIGMDSTISAVKQGKAKLVFVARDVSDKSKKEIEFACQRHNVKIYFSQFTMDEIASQIGKRSGILSVNSKQFADAIFIKTGGITDDGKI